MQFKTDFKPENYENLEIFVNLLVDELDADLYLTVKIMNRWSDSILDATVTAPGLHALISKLNNAVYDILHNGILEDGSGEIDEIFDKIFDPIFERINAK